MFVTYDPCYQDTDVMCGYRDLYVVEQISHTITTVYDRMVISGKQHCNADGIYNNKSEEQIYYQVLFNTYSVLITLTFYPFITMSYINV